MFMQTDESIRKLDSGILTRTKFSDNDDMFYTTFSSNNDVNNLNKCKKISISFNNEESNVIFYNLTIDINLIEKYACYIKLYYHLYNIEAEKFLNNFKNNDDFKKDIIKYIFNDKIELDFTDESQNGNDYITFKINRDGLYLLLDEYFRYNDDSCSIYRSYTLTPTY